MALASFGRAFGSRGSLAPLALALALLGLRLLLVLLAFILVCVLVVFIIIVRRVRLAVAAAVAFFGGALLRGIRTLVRIVIVVIVIGERSFALASFLPLCNNGGGREGRKACTLRKKTRAFVEYRAKGYVLDTESSSSLSSWSSSSIRDDIACVACERTDAK